MSNFEFNKMNFNYDKDYEEDLAPVMIRQRHKCQLISTTNYELKSLSQYQALWGKKYKKVVKDIMKDYFSGVKCINKKNPIFIEMPTLKKVGNGQIKKEYDDNFDDKPQDEEIEVHSALSSPSTPAGYLEK